uniref:SFRICE_033532 n=1 Tax=Spodoptera frugiperda TaxID=7108 RepID=A0A2H1WXY2_SPOFR
MEAKKKRERRRKFDIRGSSCNKHAKLYVCKRIHDSEKNPRSNIGTGIDLQTLTVYLLLLASPCGFTGDPYTIHIMFTINSSKSKPKNTDIRRGKSSNNFFSIFKNGFNKIFILKKTQIKSTLNRRACMKRLMTVDEAKETVGLKGEVRRKCIT